MKTYNKEKLHEYAKELFALCLEKEISFNITVSEVRVVICRIEYRTYLYRSLFGLKETTTLPIWGLIEKVKAL